MIRLGKPTPNQAAVDLTDRLLRDTELIGDHGLCMAGLDPATDCAHLTGVEFRHAVPRSPIVAAVKSLVVLVRALIAPGEMTRVATHSVPAEMTSGLSRRARAVRFFRNDAVGVSDSVLPTAKSDASVSLEFVAGERPALVWFTNGYATPKTIVQGALHRVNSSRRAVFA